jgi:putative transposase
MARCNPAGTRTKKGQTYTAKQKAKIVLELLKEERTINQIASEYKVTVKSIQNWKRQFLENASLAFNTDKVANQYKKQIEGISKELGVRASLFTFIALE